MNESYANIESNSILFQDNKKIVLTGNPNVGKSVFFNSLTGIYVDVSNFPGTTVDLTIGKFNDLTVIDTPGIYGISSFNDEECVARDIILYGDLILNIVDAVHLERDLFLTQQLIDMGKPMIIALNMMDEVEKNGISIDIDKLSKLLGVDIIPTSAVNKEGLNQVKSAILKGGKIGNKINEIEEIIDKVKHSVKKESEALLVLEEDETILSRNNLEKNYAYRDYFYKLRRDRVNKILNSTVNKVDNDSSFLNKFGNLFLKPITGIPLLLLLLFIIYQIVGVFIAQTVVGVTEEIVMGEYYYNFIMSIMTKIVDQNSFIGQLLIGEFGVVTMVPIYLFGLLLPLVIGFYFFLSILEDSGLLPRIATLVDKFLNYMGLNGRAIIPLILGFGCVTMATITTRILGSRRERFIATMLLSVAIPCSAQLGIIVGLVAQLGIKLVIIYALTICLVFVLVGTFMNKLLPGESTYLLIDIPPIRVPLIGNILKKTILKTKMFIIEAGPLFVLGGIIITVLKYTNLLSAISKLFAPITVGFLKLPSETTQTFIMGIIRRDFGAAGLNSMVAQGALTPLQLVVALVVITLFVPCFASIMVIFKERKLSDAIAIWFSSFIISFVTAGILANIIM